ncbi:voltage-dependent calcium channel gamma-7 subunit-like, partial [Malurus melanocephalus]|uniref:voltage-dependent calcium channel gamma-7 subunit-like n=1 Tax=Malurus melanocephalus TaxID=175006 RepID=UPI0025473532
TVRTATPFPMVSLFLVFTAFVISNVGHIRPQRTLLAFVSGIFFILSGVTQVTGVTGDTGDTQVAQVMASGVTQGSQVSLRAQGAGVMSVYLFTKRYAEEELCHTPGVSQWGHWGHTWTHLDTPGHTWTHPMSIQMSQNYPPAIKYPQRPPPHPHLSTSPC